MSGEPEAKKTKMTSSLEQLRKFTKIVADTGDFITMQQYSPTDATTNPSLILEVSKGLKNQDLIDEAVRYALKHAEKTDDRIHTDSLQTELAMDMVCVLFGCKILEYVPGRVSTEVDARLSFNTQEMVNRAIRLIKLYEEKKVDRSRVLIKLAATWEGIEAGRILESEHNIRVNMTLIFTEVQAVACALAGVTLISPFVGRISDWEKAYGIIKSFPPHEDPGVRFVRDTFLYFKKFGYKTEIMGASFRNLDQIKLLAGCDLLTISPKLLEQLANSTDPVTQKLSVDYAKVQTIDPHPPINEATFRFAFNQDEMATEKLAEGIRNFTVDANHLAMVVGSRKVCVRL